MKIAGLDIETLSLDVTAVVFEIGVSIYDTGSGLLTTELLIPDVTTQMAAGRSISQKTIKWHVDTSHGGSDPGFAARLAVNRPYATPLGIDQTYYRLQTLLSDVDELWINGLSFDPGVLASLFSPYHPGRDAIPWHYRKENDVRTIRRFLALPGFPQVHPPVDLVIRDELKHNAVPDSIWNIAQAYIYAEGMKKLISDSRILASM